MRNKIAKLIKKAFPTPPPGSPPAVFRATMESREQAKKDRAAMPHRLRGRQTARLSSVA